MQVNNNLSKYCKRSCDTIQTQRQRVWTTGLYTKSVISISWPGSLHHCACKTSVHFISWFLTHLKQYFYGNRGRTSPDKLKSFILVQVFSLLPSKPFIIDARVSLSLIYFPFLSPDGRRASKEVTRRWATEKRRGKNSGWSTPSKTGTTPKLHLWDVINLQLNSK